MKRFPIQKKRLLISLIVVMGLGVFALFNFKNYTLYPLVEKEPGCYLYQSDEDIKNIARHAIIDKFGEKVLIAQKQLSIYKDDTEQKGVQEIIVNGEARSLLVQLVALVFQQGYLYTARVAFEDNGQCLRITSVLFYKD